MADEPIIVELMGGLVTNVIAPLGVTIEVRDFDTEGMDEDDYDRLDADESGKRYWRTVWADGLQRGVGETA